MTSVPRVLHSFPTWLPQTQTWLFSQVSEQQRCGLSAHVFCERTANLGQFRVENLHALTDHPKWVQIADRVIRLTGLRRHLHTMVRTGKQIHPEVIHSHFGHVGWANCGAVKELGAKHIVTFYGYDVNKLPQQRMWQKRYKALFGEVDRVLCEGSHMADCIVQLGCPRKKVHVHHLGVDLRNISFQPRSWIPGQELKVLIAASFREKKGIPYAIAALAMLSRDIPIRITIIGDAGNDIQSQEEKASIMRALSESGLLQKTTLLGFQAHSVLLREAYAHHVYLHPSVTAADGDTEGGAPVSVIEMLASGMPVISTWHCDIPEVMGPLLSQYMAPERNCEALANCIRQLYASASDWERRAAASRTHIEANYDQEKQNSGLISHYLEVVSGANH